MSQHKHCPHCGSGNRWAATNRDGTRRVHHHKGPRRLIMRAIAFSCMACETEYCNIENCRGHQASQTAAKE